jgi:hypothetical protein
MKPKSALDLFVNRDDEKDRFCELLNSGEKAIMIVWGKDGLGKTFLMDWMIHECAQRTLAKAELFWSNSRKYDPYGVMRRIRDDLGVLKYFSHFTELINYYTDPSSTDLSQPLEVVTQGKMSVADKAKFINSKVRDVANVIIRDSMIVVPRQDIGVPMEERLIRLTDLFIPSLAAATEKKPCWIFLDVPSNKKHFSPEVKSWLWDELFSAVVRGKLPNVGIVMCVAPKPSPNTKFLTSVEEANLQAFDRGQVEEYMKLCGMNETLGVGEERRLGMLDAIMWQTKGVPKGVALMVDGMVKDLKEERRKNSGR